MHHSSLRILALESYCTVLPSTRAHGWWFGRNITVAHNGVLNPLPICMSEKPENGKRERRAEVGPMDTFRASDKSRQRCRARGGHARSTSIVERNRFRAHLSTTALPLNSNRHRALRLRQFVLQNVTSVSHATPRRTNANKRRGGK